MQSAATGLLAPAPAVEPIPPAEVERQYPRYRWRILEATFLGYATFYVVRNNLSVVGKDIEESLHYTKGMVGDILAVTAIAYGLGKFLMGAVSDRSDPRKFMALGMLLTAVLNFAFGSVESYPLHLALWGLNGFVQGMGWPPCGRSIGHWFSVRERGSVFAVWNISHNVGGGLVGIIVAWAAGLGGWQYAFYVPGVIALVGAAYLFLRLVDTPQSVGLPPVEEYRNDFTEAEKRGERHETELPFKALIVEHVLKNRVLWLVAFANFFVYIVRYSMLDWGPVYLREAKGTSLAGGGFGVFVLEFGGIPSTLLMGWLSDRMGGRRGLVSLLCMVPILAAFGGLLVNPAGNLWLDLALLATIGFFVYPPVMLLGVAALDLTSKKAVGTAAGFVGLFGYLGRTVEAKGLAWIREDFGKVHGAAAGWSAAIWAILACTVAAIALLALTRNVKPRA